MPNKWLIRNLGMLGMAAQPTVKQEFITLEIKSRHRRRREGDKH